MRDILEGAAMAALVIAVLAAAYLLIAFLLAGADAEKFRWIMESLI
jgi:hypothetical protein